MWVGSLLVLRVHYAWSAIALVPSQLDCSQMVVPQPTVSEAQPVRGGKQKQGLRMAKELKRKQQSWRRIAQ